jgi:acyl carrier protein
VPGKEDVQKNIVSILAEIYPDREDISIDLRMEDLDSFGIVQLLLALEELYDIAVLEGMSTFQGETLAEFRDFFLTVQESESAPA